MNPQEVKWVRFLFSINSTFTPVHCGMLMVDFFLAATLRGYSTVWSSACTYDLQIPECKIIRNIQIVTNKQYVRIHLFDSCCAGIRLLWNMAIPVIGSCPNGERYGAL